MLAVVVQQERPATDAARLRFDQGQHHLHGNGSIHRAAAGAQNLVPRIGGQGIGRGDRQFLVGPTGFLLVTGGDLGLSQQLLVGRCGGIGTRFAGRRTGT